LYGVGNRVQPLSAGRSSDNSFSDFHSKVLVDCKR